MRVPFYTYILYVLQTPLFLTNNFYFYYIHFHEHMGIIKTRRSLGAGNIFYDLKKRFILLYISAAMLYSVCHGIYKCEMLYYRRKENGRKKK